MANSIDTILDQALEMLQKGRSKEEVLLSFKEYEKELSPLLDLSLCLFTIPKNIAPEPAMQRKYISLPTKNFWLTWIHVSKFAGVSMSLVLLLSAFTFTTVASLRSNPGQVLFSVKKTAEKVQLILAYNQEQKANLQIKITQKRLNEAREIFSNPDSNIKQEQAALKELSDQTSNTVIAINSVTKNNPQSDKNHPLLSTLENITKDQQSLLSEIKPNSEVKIEANSAQQTLNENSAKITEIKHFVSVASNEQALAKLGTNPNSVIVSGEITQISKTELTVEKTNFEINAQTIIKDAEGKNITLTDLKLKNKINVVGIKNDKEITAVQISITPIPEGIVKGSSTSTITTINEKPATATNSSIQKIAEPVAPDPNEASGSFIIEDPAPQFQNN